MQIEKIEPTIKANPVSPSAPADASSQTAIAQQGLNAGEALTHIGDKMIEAQAFAQKTNATNQIRAGLNDIVLKHSQDPDPSNTDKYIQQFQSIKDQASKSLTLAAAKSEFSAEWGQASNSAMLDIQKQHHQKIVMQGAAATSEGLDQLEKTYLQTGDPTKQSQAVASITKLVDEAVQRGFITPEEGFKQKKGFMDSLGVKKFDTDLQSANDPQTAQAILQSLQDGHYEQNGVEIQPEKRKAMIDNAEHKISFLESRQTKAAEIQMKNITHDDTVKALYNQLPATALEEQFYSNPPQISKTTFDELSKTVDGVGHTADTNDSTYLSVIQKLTDPKYTADQKRSMILASNHNGFLSLQDAQKLYEMHLTPAQNGNISLEDMIGKQQAGDDFQKMVSEHNAANKAVDDKNAWLKPAIQKISSFFSGPNKTSDTVNAVKTLYDNIATNKIPNEQIPSEADKILGQANIKMMPEIASYPKEGKVRVDRYGNKARVFPDGTVKETK